jgi:hypothetical protein
MQIIFVINLLVERDWIRAALQVRSGPKGLRNRKEHSTKVTILKTFFASGTGLFHGMFHEKTGRKTSMVRKSKKKDHFSGNIENADSAKREPPMKAFPFPDAGNNRQRAGLAPVA